MEQDSGALYPQNNAAAGNLYVVATPIGNLEDISKRATRVLKEVDFIAAEDTRHSSRLLDSLAISKPLIALHEHNESAQAAKLVGKLLAGNNIALVSDAGTPLISDPGYRLVKAAREVGVRVVPLPGACALVAALSVCGLPTDSFLFKGFLPARSTARIKELETLQSLQATLVFYEAPHRIEATIQDMGSIFGLDREAVLARELTKTYETVLSGSLESVLRQIRQDDNQQRGEMVIVVRGAPTREIHDDVPEDVVRVLAILLEDHSLKQAASLASRITGWKKNRLYDLALKRKVE